MEEWKGTFGEDMPGLPGLEGEIGSGLHGEQEVVEQGEGTVPAVPTSGRRRNC